MCPLCPVYQISLSCTKRHTIISDAEPSSQKRCIQRFPSIPSQPNPIHFTAFEHLSLYIQVASNQVNLLASSNGGEQMRAPSCSTSLGRLSLMWIVLRFSQSAMKFKLEGNLNTVSERVHFIRSQNVWKFEFLTFETPHTPTERILQVANMFHEKWPSTSPHSLLPPNTILKMKVQVKKKLFV